MTKEYVHPVSMKRRTGILVLACIAGGLAAVALTQWLSWYWLSQADRYAGQIAETGWIKNEQEWHRYRELLQRWRTFDPYDPQIYWQAGELEYWNAAGLRLWPDRRREKLRTAEQQYTLAVIRSPFNGDQLARAAYRLASMNNSPPAALMRRALEVAPYEPVVQYHLAAIGMQFWDELDPHLKEGLEKTLVHAMGNYQVAAQIRKLAKQRGRLEWLAGFDQASR